MRAGTGILKIIPCILQHSIASFEIFLISFKCRPVRPWFSHKCTRARTSNQQSAGLVPARSLSVALRSAGKQAAHKRAATIRAPSHAPESGNEPCSQGHTCHNCKGAASTSAQPRICAHIFHRGVVAARFRRSHTLSISQNGCDW